MLSEQRYSIDTVADYLFSPDIRDQAVQQTLQLSQEVGISLPTSTHLERLHTILLLLSASALHERPRILQALQQTFAGEVHPEHSHKTTKELLIVVTVVALWCLDHVQGGKLESDTRYGDRIRTIGDDLSAMTKSFTTGELIQAKAVSSRLMENLKVLFAVDPIGMGEPIFFCFDFDDIDGGKTKHEQYYPYYQRAYQLLGITDRQEQYALYCTAAGSFDLRFCFTAYTAHRKKEFLYHESLHALLPGLSLRLLDEAMTEWMSFRQLHFLRDDGGLPSRSTLYRRDVDQLYYRQLQALFVIFEKIAGSDHLLEALYRTGEPELLLEFAQRLWKSVGPESYALIFLADPDQYNPARRDQPWISPTVLITLLQTTRRTSL